MFRINIRSSQPIYEQLLENIEEMILAGVFLKDEQLPSVRAIARDLAVNPNTIQKAYGILEERGIIYSRPGRGSFVAVDGESLQAQRIPAALEKLDDLLDGIFKMGMSEEDVIDHIHSRYAMFQERGDQK